MGHKNAKFSAYFRDTKVGDSDLGVTERGVMATGGTKGLLFAAI